MKTYNCDNWRADALKHCCKIKVMQLFYAEANIDGLVKLSPGTIELKNPPRQECIVYLIARRAINLFVYLKGLLGYDFFLDFFRLLFQIHL